MTPTAHRKHNFRHHPLAFTLAALSLLGIGCENEVQEWNLEEHEDGLLYEKGAHEPFTGIWTQYHMVLGGHRKALSIHYEKGLPQGPFETFYPHGITKQSGGYVVVPHKGSVKHGKFLAWRENGTLIYEKFYKEGELHGPYLLCHDKWSEEKRKADEVGNQPENDITVEYEVKYQNGLPHGEFRRLDRDGNLIESGTYQEGAFDGEQAFYYPTIHLLAIRDHRNLLRPTRFPATVKGYEIATAQATSIAESTPHNPDNQPVHVAGYGANGELLTTLWNTQQTEKSWSELSKPRPKYLRKWRVGKVLQTIWLDPDGKQIVLKMAIGPWMGKDVNVVAGTIAIVNHGLKTGDRINYLKGADANIGNMTSTMDYFAIVYDKDTFSIADTRNLALNGAARNIGPSTGGDTGTFTLQMVVGPWSGNDDVNVVAETITIVNHGLETGDRINYLKGANANIGNMISTMDYFAIVYDKNTFSIADTRNLALNGTARNIGPSTGGDTGIFTLQLEKNQGTDLAEGNKTSTISHP